MQIKFRTEDVLPHLQMAASVVNAKHPIQILGNIMFEAVKDDNGSMLIVTAADGEMWLSIKCPINDCDTNAKFCVDARNIVQTLRNITNFVVTLELDAEKHILNASYGKGHFSLPYIDCDDYPICPSNNDAVTSKTIASSCITNAIDSTEYAAGNDDLRPVMSGIHFDFNKNSMVVAATDGHKLSRHENSSIVSDNEETEGFTLPKKAAHILSSIIAKSDDNVTLSFSSKNITFSNDSFKLTACLLEYKYPKYDAVIPKDNPIKVTANRADFINAIKRVMPLGNSTNELIKLKFENNQGMVAAEDIDFSTSAKESFTCDFGQSEPFSIGFKGSYLLQILQNMQCEDVVVLLQDSTRPGLFEPNVTNDANIKHLSLLMPIMIS